MQSEFDERFEELYRVAYRVGFRLLGQHEAAQDVAQEALTRAFVHWRSLRSHPDPAAWVARVGANLACDVWRRRSSGGRAALSSPQEDAPDGIAELRMDLHRALGRLSPRQREVVVLRYLADFSERTVARTLGCSAGSAKQHAARGLAALRNDIRGLREEESPGDVRVT